MEPNTERPDHGDGFYRKSPRASSSESGASPALPSLNLPKGGGAIRGIGEKFAANPVTGTGSLGVPVYTSPGRAGFGPHLSLTYDSGSGNSAFGLGWSLNLPAITRKTDKGLPQYEDAQESDVFILSGAEDLMPSLVQAGGEWVRDVTPARTVYGNQYAIHRYRPRVEGLFARIERWDNLADPRDTFWRSISKDNITTWYGKTAESRVADPADPTRIFKWLICQTYDDKGNVIAYQYKPEDSSGVDLSQVQERNRSDLTRSANRYLKRIFYGNRTPYVPDLTAAAAAALPTDWCFELVFDYGEHDLLNPLPQESVPWNCRLDPYSTYRATFEVRTYRLCRRALMFHQFPDEANVGADCLVRSTDLSHAIAPPPDPSQPFYSYLLSVQQTGYIRTGVNGYLAKSLPPVEFAYTTAHVDETVREIDPDSLRNLPYGLDPAQYRWADLDGEGLSGILTEQAESWFYKANLSPVNRQTIDGKRYTLPLFGAVESVAKRPSPAALNGGREQLLSISGDGRLDLVNLGGPLPGFFERTDSGSWESFAPFQSLPVLDWRNPELKFIDVTGDGLTDLLVNDGEALWWYQSLGALGFTGGERAPLAFDEEKGPKVIFADSTESIFLADMSGDGLQDVVRIRNGEVCYWPNLGYGRFGSKVAMDNAPLFDRMDLFDGRRLRLADIDGSGTIDLIYFASKSVQLYFNQSGNAWGAARVLNHFPTVESVSSAVPLDLLGNGTACLVWSSRLAGNAEQPMRYIDLMGGQKPHLLVRVTNNLGAETEIQYAPSTKFYVADKLAGTPWVTRLPFPVHVVERIRNYDYISRSLLVTRYSYHHGYFDGVEREFRGFGRVDQWDTEEFATLENSAVFPQPANVNAASDVPPVCTKTWFHTGAFFGGARISKYLEHEYYAEDGLTEAQLESMLVDDTVLPVSILLPDGSRVPYDLSPEESREACRALRGSILRQEIYASDGTDEADLPYSVSERNYTIEVMQPQGPNRYGVFFTHSREQIDFHYERKIFKVTGNTLADPGAPPPAVSAADPRVTHAFTLSVDPFGNVLQTATVGYGRRYLDPALTLADQGKQSTTLGTFADSTFTNAVLADDAYRTPVPAQSALYELIQVVPSAAQPGVTNLFRFDEIASRIQAASDGAHDVPYEDWQPSGLLAGQPYRRMLKCARTLYRPDDLGASTANVQALLPLGSLQSLGLPGTSYSLALTAGLIAQVYLRGGAALVPNPAAVIGSPAADGGGYTDLDGNGNWWMPSGRVYFSPAAGTPQDELTLAQQHFFLLRRAEDPFGNASSFDYDAYDLLLVKTTDALANTVTAANDYRVLLPSLLTDANGNRAAASFDALGLVAARALMGKTTETIGDSLSGFVPDLTAQQIDDFFSAADPHTLAGPLLGNATTRMVYDVDRFQNSRAAAPGDITQWQPAFAATLARETHVSDLTAGQQTKIQIEFSYSDGFCREIQKKVQAEPAPGGTTPRWVGNGWTIFNNKNKPVRQYEPFFSQIPKGHQFEFGVTAGVSPILCYDPLVRVVATLHPNYTFEKVVFDPWHQDSWDVNDTVLETDPTADPDVGSFFERLPNGDYAPTWYTQRSTGGLGALEQAAAGKAAAHANTPAHAYFDTLGRPFLTIADNGPAGKYASHIELDVEGNQRSVTDPLGRTAMTYDYNVLGHHLHQASMESAERWMLHDVLGQPIRAWDTRGHNFRTSYDALRRPTQWFVLGTDATNSDPRTLAGEVLFEEIVYGEGQANDTALNLRTRVFQHFDTAGVSTNVGHNNATNQDEGYDFKGNPLRGSRQFVADYKGLPNWTVPPALQPASFASSTQYDALNRVITNTAPDGSVIANTYNDANLLETVNANLQGAAAATAFVTNIDYDAKGQRVLIQYGNPASTAFVYDPLTFRLTNCTTTRQGFPADQQTVQDLSYTYDPVGNITHIQDDAQDAIFFSNKLVAPSNDYTYDPIYRLTNASGREHLGQNGGGVFVPVPASYNDVPRVHLLQPGDGNAMGTYTEQYVYDAAGNFQQYVHTGADPANPGWTRSYTYNEPSLLEPAKTSNRLTSSTVSGAQPFVEAYAYNSHGNMIRMPQLQSMQSDFKDQLIATQRQAVNAGDADGVQHQGERTYYVYDSAGRRTRKATERANGTLMKERLYLGGYEVYREYDASGGVVTLERQTLHVMDDRKRIALVETRTQGNDGSAKQLIRYQFCNHLCSADLELDDTAEVISYEEYYPYGCTSYQAGRSVTEVSLKRYRFSGKERDDESGLAYYGLRYCALEIGRWTSCDPAGFGDGLNLYQFTKSNPVTLVDSRGTDSKNSEETLLQHLETVVEDRYADELAKVNVVGDTVDKAIIATFVSLGEMTLPSCSANVSQVDLFDIGAAMFATRYHLETQFGAAAARGEAVARARDARTLYMWGDGSISTRAQRATYIENMRLQRAFQTLENMESGLGGTLGWALGGDAGSDLGAAVDGVATAMAGTIEARANQPVLSASRPNIELVESEGVPPPSQPPLIAGPYRPRGGPASGHHVHQSASFATRPGPSDETNPNHDQAIAIQQNVPGFSGAQHDLASAAQRNINRAVRGNTVNQPVIGPLTISVEGNGTNVTPSIYLEDVKALFALLAGSVSSSEAYRVVTLSGAQIDAAGAQVTKVPSR